MKKNRLTNLEAFKLPNSSLHRVMGGTYTCSTGSATCSGSNGDSDAKDPNTGQISDVAYNTYNGTGNGNLGNGNARS